MTIALSMTLSVGRTSINEFRRQVLFAKTVGGVSQRNIQAKNGLIECREHLPLFRQFGMTFEKFPKTILVFNESILLQTVIIDDNNLRIVINFGQRSKNLHVGPRVFQRPHNVNFRHAFLQFGKVVLVLGFVVAKFLGHIELDGIQLRH